MSATDQFLAVFIGGSTSSNMAAWLALPQEEQLRRQQAGMAAWHGWVATHQANIVTMGGPLGKTKKVSAAGVEDISNAMAAFTIVRADSAEAAAAMFENHPHFAIFPGDSVEIMPVMPVPAG